MIRIIILIIVLLLSLFLINKTLKKKDNILEEVKLQENAIKNNGFALMLEQEDGTYIEDISSIFPTDMKFNSELSGCIDLNGNKIDNSLSFDKENNIVNVSVGQTAFCYVYFDIKKDLLTDYLVNNKNEDELWENPEEDGYRYVGTSVNNYICFGTTDKDTCISDTAKYMYRIIGIFNGKDGNKHTKLIKKEALIGGTAWNKTTESTTEWNNSSLYKELNGTRFLTNTDYSYLQEDIWLNKITTSTWKYGDISVWNATADRMYAIENGWTKTIEAKIGLMYLYDYYYGLEGGNNCSNNGDYSVCKTSWIYLWQEGNDTGAPNTSYEWTISRGQYDEYGETQRAMYITTNGDVRMGGVTNSMSARPVFYLESNVEILDGTGTITDPYIIVE